MRTTPPSVNLEAKFFLSPIYNNSEDVRCQVLTPFPSQRGAYQSLSMMDMYKFAVAIRAHLNSFNYLNSREKLGSGFGQSLEFLKKS